MAGRRGQGSGEVHQLWPDTPTSLRQHRPGAPSVVALDSVAPRFGPRLRVHNLHHLNPDDRATPTWLSNAAAPCVIPQSLSSLSPVPGVFVMVTSGALPVTKLAWKWRNPFAFAPLNQNPPHVSERAMPLMARVEQLALSGSTRVLRHVKATSTCPPRPPVGNIGSSLAVETRWLTNGYNDHRLPIARQIASFHMPQSRYKR